MTQAKLKDKPNPRRYGVAGAQTKRKKQEKILHAARGVFLSCGYEGASMDQIAASAGVSKATLYAHFDNKENLFSEMQSDYLNAQEDAISAIERSNVDTVEGLHRIAQVMIEAWAEPNALRFSRMIMGESARYPQLGRLFVETGIYRLQTVLERVLKSLDSQGELTIPDPELAAELFIGMIRSPIQMRSLHALGAQPDRAELDRLALAAVQMAVAAFTKR